MDPIDTALERVGVSDVAARCRAHRLAKRSLSNERREVLPELIEVIREEPRAMVGYHQVGARRSHRHDGTAVRLRFQERDSGPVLQIWKSDEVGRRVVPPEVGVLDVARPTSLQSERFCPSLELTPSVPVADDDKDGSTSDGRKRI